MRKRWPEYYSALLAWLTLPMGLVWFSRHSNPFHDHSLKHLMLAVIASYIYYTLHRRLFKFIHKLRREEISRLALLLILEESSQEEMDKHGTVSGSLGDNPA